MAKKVKSANRYQALIERIFFEHWSEGAPQFEFERSEIERFADELDIELPDNQGDLIYYFRFRSALPDKILATQRDGLEWIIGGCGQVSLSLSSGQNHSNTSEPTSSEHRHSRCHS